MADAKSWQTKRFMGENNLQGGSLETGVTQLTNHLVALLTCRKPVFALSAEVTRQRLCLLPDFAGILRIHCPLGPRTVSCPNYYGVRGRPKGEPRHKDCTWRVTLVEKVSPAWKTPDTQSYFPVDTRGGRSREIGTGPCTDVRISLGTSQT